MKVKPGTAARLGLRKPERVGYVVTVGSRRTWYWVPAKDMRDLKVRLSLNSREPR